MSAGIFLGGVRYGQCLPTCKINDICSLRKNSCEGRTYLVFLCSMFPSPIVMELIFTLNTYTGTVTLKAVCSETLSSSQHRSHFCSVL